MERPHGKTQPKQREVTGEIVYLDEMRRRNERPQPYEELADMAIQMYEAEADMYPEGERPAIIEEYERYDFQPSEVVTSCTALADELLALKNPDSPLTFVDIVVESDPDTVLTKLQTIAAGKILADQDAQLAIASDGKYYPILDFRKENATLVGTGLRVWGWDDRKYVFTNEENEPYEYPKHALFYPTDEKSSTRQIELSFSYRDAESRGFTESVSLYLGAGGSASISSNLWSMAYAETGYEGHGGSSLDNFTDDDIAAFGDLVAEIVGDTPESIAMRIDRKLQELIETAATPAAQQAVHNLIEATWPAQANYLLRRKQEGTSKTIADQLCDPATAEAATEAVGTIIEEWSQRVQG